MGHFGRHDWYREAFLDLSSSEETFFEVVAPARSVAVYIRCSRPGCLAEDARVYVARKKIDVVPEFVKRSLRERKVAFRDAQDAGRLRVLRREEESADGRLIQAKPGPLQRLACRVGLHPSWWLVALTHEEVAKLLSGVPLKLEEACVYCGKTRMVRGARANREFLAQQVGAPSSEVNP